LRKLDYASERERALPANRRTRYRGALAGWEITDPDTSEPISLRVAYIHSSEEARETAAARERALQKAEAALARVRNGLGGRYYKTRRQVDTRVARPRETYTKALLADTPSLTPVGAGTV
jgi:hypothetical protein